MMQLPDSARVKAQEAIGNDKVYYSETPNFLEANLVTLLVFCLCTTVFIIQIGVALFGTLELEGYEFIPLPAWLEFILKWTWYWIVLALCLRSLNIYRRRFLVLTSTSVIYCDGQRETPVIIKYADLIDAAIIEGDMIRSCFKSDVILSFKASARAFRLRSLRNPASVEARLRAMI